MLTIMPKKMSSLLLTRKALARFLRSIDLRFIPWKSVQWQG